MSKRTSDSIRTRTRTAAASATSDRRTRLRLRDLCDEVIASFRVARGDELLSHDERAEANAMLAQLTPAMTRPTA